MKALSILITSFLWIAMLHGQGFYPLQPGNVWQYTEMYDTSTITTRAVSDTTMPNSSVYMHLKSNYLFGDEYLRESGAGVYTYQPYYHIEELAYDFSKTTGDTVAFHNLSSDTSFVTVLYDDTVNTFGTSRRVWGFLEQSTRTSVYALREVTDSIGMTYFQIEPGLAFHLTGAVINGNIYGTLTDVRNPLQSVPWGYQLTQNYPNPFNPTTTIAYDLPRRSNVHLSIYDILGREVTTIVDGVQEPGRHAAKFDGSHLASGAYIYELRVEDFRSRKMMVIVK